MKTSGQNRQKVYIVTYLICVIQVYGASLTITQYPQYPTVSTNAILTCHIPSFTVGAQWFRNGSSLTLCQSSLCFPPSITGYQFTADATTMNVTISSINIALGDTIWRCSHNGGNDIGSIILTVYKPPSSSLSIVGDNNRTLADGDTVVLSVSTGCITPSDSAHYNVTWKYVEANNTAEKNFDEKITQYVNSSGGCTNTYEDNLQFNLIVTNDINTANTDLYISQVKMTFTMAGTDFIATKTVSYTLKAKATTTTTTTTTTEENKTGKIVGGTIGGYYGVCLLVILGRVIYVFCIKEKCNKKKGNSVGSDPETGSKPGNKKKGNSVGSDPETGSKQEENSNGKIDGGLKDKLIVVVLKILICDFWKRCKGNVGKTEGENGSESINKNGQQKSTTKSKKGESVPNHPLMKPNKIGHQDEVNHESVQVKTFDQNERRPLPINPADNDGNKRGTSANLDDDTPRAKKLAPINPQLLSTIQGEDTSEKPRKKKKKKKKNKKTDEIKSTDDLAE